MKQRLPMTMALMAIASMGIVAGAESGGRQKAVIYAGGKLWEATRIGTATSLQIRSWTPVQVVTMDLTDVSVRNAIRHICMGAAYTFRVEKEAVVVRPRRGECFPDFFFQIFRVSAHFPTTVHGRVSDAELKEYLASCGVSFADGTRLHYDAKRQLLFARNTPQGLRNIQKVLEWLEVFEAKAFEIERPLPPPPADVAWKGKLDIVIPHLTLESTPVGAALLKVAQAAKKADPEGKGINVILVDDAYDYPVVFTEEEWMRQIELLGPVKDDKEP